MIMMVTLQSIHASVHNSVYINSIKDDKQHKLRLRIIIIIIIVILIIIGIALKEMLGSGY